MQPVQSRSVRRTSTDLYDWALDLELRHEAHDGLDMGDLDLGMELGEGAWPDAEFRVTQQVCCCLLLRSPTWQSNNKQLQKKYVFWHRRACRSGSASGQSHRPWPWHRRKTWDGLNKQGKLSSALVTGVFCRHYCLVDSVFSFH